MKILVVAAMPNEMKAIKEGIKSAGLKSTLDIDFLCCGIGNYETISSLEYYLTENPESIFIRNIGICGYWNSNNEKKSDPIQISNVINVHTEKEMIIPPFLQIAPFKTCFSGENVIYKKPDFKKQIGTTNDEMFFDMESRGIEFIASKYKIPHLILKVPFDFIGEETRGFKNEKSLNEILTLLGYLDYHIYLSKILERINKGEHKF